jgi:hypothetical protein
MSSYKEFLQQLTPEQLAEDRKRNDQQADMLLECLRDVNKGVYAKAMAAKAAT